MLYLIKWLNKVKRRATMTTPAYMRVYNTLRSQITEKQYDIGAILPPEPKLEKIFCVSRTTIRKAIDMLVREGLLSVRQGFGTQVISRKTVQNLNRFSSISDSIVKNGKKLGLKSCYIEKVEATKELASMLNISVGSRLICIHRIKTSNDSPICLIKNYIPEQMLPDFDMDTPLPLLYEYLKEHYSIVYTSSKDIISACNATFEQSQMLGIKPQAALLHVHRICYMGFHPCEVDIVDIIADLYEYEVFLGEQCNL